MRHVSICSTILSEASLGTTTMIETSNHPPLTKLLLQIVHLPISWRKLILDACRIQAPILQNHNLLMSLYSLQPESIACHHGDTVHKIIFSDDLVHLIDYATSSSVSSSLLSYFVRAEATCRVEEFSEEVTKSLDKELTAALGDCRFQESCLDYSGLFGGGCSSLHLIPVGLTNQRLSHLYQAGINHLRRALASTSFKPLLPVYNDRKNIAWDSQETFLASTGMDPSEDRSITTLDLLKHYYLTGETITGPLELRQAWFHNDLKPRTYYCQGGSSYFGALYIQQVANWVVDFLPSTNRHSRYNIQRLNPTSPHSLIVTYDYSSFTTSLEELQHFTHWLGTSLLGISIEVLDVRSGIRSIDLGQYIIDYNASFNVNDRFSVERFFAGGGTLYQNRGGSLGVKGNITFSTALHGAALGSITGTPDFDCCVGDDALVSIDPERLSLFMDLINYLGEINPSKVTVIPHPADSTYDVFQNRFKFLKRPLYRRGDGNVMMGVLDFFPAIADVVSIPDTYHTVRCKSAFDVAVSFSMQLGRFLSIQLHEIGFTLDQADYEFVLEVFAFCYRKIGLPIGGALPGKVLIEGFKVECFIPPVHPDVFTIHWMECLMGEYVGTMFDRPVFISGVIDPPFDCVEGERFSCTPSPFLELLVALKLFDSEVEMVTVRFDDTELDFQMRLMSGDVLKDENLMLKTYSVISLPSWYFEYAVLFQPDLVCPDTADTLSTVTSLIG